MAQTTAGLAGNESIILFAGIQDDTQPQGIRLVSLDSLDGPELGQWRKFLLEDPAFAELLANFKPEDVKTESPDETPLGGNPEIPSGDAENTKVADDVDVNDLIQTEANHGEGQETGTATTGKDHEHGDSSPNGSSRATSASRETASSAASAKPTKRKKAIKQGNPSTEKSSKKKKQNPRNVGIRCKAFPHALGTQRNTTFAPNDPAISHSIELEFTAPLQKSKIEWRCEKLGWFYNLLAQPADNGKQAPLPCMKCAGCVRYELFLKSLQYKYGAPAPIQTVMEFQARTPRKAREFTGNRQHARRLPGTRRLSLLDQKAVKDDEDGTRKSCQGVLIWDGEIPEPVRIQMEKHACKLKMTHVKVYAAALDETKLRDMLPTRLRLPGLDINTCHFSPGWAKKRLPYSDWRDGVCRVVGIADGGIPVTELWQPERAKAIAQSWRPLFYFEQDNDLPPAERERERRWAMPYLHRARFVDFLDWLYSMSSRALKFTKFCINQILDGEEPNLKALETWTSAPKQLVLETAAFLMGKREPEPALTLAAEKLGFISMPGKFPDRHIDPEFLAQLTENLPLLLSHEGPRVPAHLTAHTSEPTTVYAQLDANHPTQPPSTESDSHAELAMAA